MVMTHEPTLSGTSSVGEQAPGVVADALRTAQNVCQERGVRLNPIRLAVLRALWEAEQPMGAYDLLRAIEAQVDRKLAPPTIYRALSFLLEHGLISRIETRSAFTPCTRPADPHAGVFFFCHACGRSTEIENERAELLLDRDAATLGFKIERRVIEIEGMCVDCQSAGDGTR